MIEIVPFDSGMMEELRRACNRNLNQDVITDWTFRRITLGDPNFDGKYTLVAFSSEKIAGFLLGVRRIRIPEAIVENQKAVAWIKLFFVEEEYRRKGIGTMLFDRLESIFRAEGIRYVRVSDFPAWHFSSGVDLKYQEAVDFLSKRGYRKVGEAVDYEIDLLDFFIPRRLLKVKLDGVTIRRADHRDKEKVLSRITNSFSPFWGIEAANSFRFDKPKIWIAEQEDKVIGFSIYGALEPHWFGPIGVDPEIRTKGIGSILLFNCLKDMREEGQRIAVIPWTSHLFFYTQVPGIKRVRHYWMMQKELV